MREVVPGDQGHARQYGHEDVLVWRGVERSTAMSQHTQGRVEKNALETIDRTKRVVFDFEGRQIEAFEGDTIASALCAAGVRIFSRSFKYHRPRGLLCVSGQCPNCMVNVDAEPNVRC